MVEAAQSFGLFIIMAIVIELCVGVLKEKLPEKVLKVFNPNIQSILFGVVLAISFSQNVFSEFGMSTSIPFIAEIFTGFLLAGGSKLWHEFINRLRG